MSCPVCANHVCAAVPKPRGKRKAKPGRRYTVSVSKEQYAMFVAAAEAKGWSVRRLVEEALRGV